MEIDIEQLWVALRDLQMTIDVAKNLVFNGKIVQCDRRLQSAQVRCNNILNYVTEVKAQNGIVVNQNTPEESRPGEQSDNEPTGTE